MSTQVREGSAPNFCPPVEEGLSFTFQDQNGDTVQLEFLGLLMHEDARYGFFFQIDEEAPALSSGEVVVLEVTELDADGQPDAFEFVEDEAVVRDVYEAFKQATRDLYRFE
ncbi:DUF1292 domain-containing protein [Adlercreutzia murintestinalis]|uniref:DUF1292 domain-containing protein n=1 Tax=Adlercreutzia murintestinalis TaxID=2941325 RepID=UPI00203C301F|nr:DUF1292 domain-containing protein [Adlercreutzia murintestinalis]